MSFLKKLFGLGDVVAASDKSMPAVAATQTHEGFTIRATPYKEGGRFQLCGVIAKEIDGVVKEHQFIRADTFATIDDAVEMVFFKARQIIDQQGEHILK